MTAGRSRMRLQSCARAAVVFLKPCGYAAEKVLGDDAFVLEAARQVVRFGPSPARTPQNKAWKPRDAESRRGTEGSEYERSTSIASLQVAAHYP